MDWLKLLISNIACWEAENFKTEDLASLRQFLGLNLRLNLAKGFGIGFLKIIIELNKLSLQFRTCKINCLN